LLQAKRLRRRKRRKAFKAYGRKLCNLPVIVPCRRNYSTKAELYEYHRLNGTLAVFWMMYGLPEREL